MSLYDIPAIFGNSNTNVIGKCTLISYDHKWSRVILLFECKRYEEQKNNPFETSVCTAWKVKGQKEI